MNECVYSISSTQWLNAYSRNNFDYKYYLNGHWQCNCCFLNPIHRALGSVLLYYQIFPLQIKKGSRTIWWGVFHGWLTLPAIRNRLQWRIWWLQQEKKGCKTKIREKKSKGIGQIDWNEWFERTHQKQLKYICGWGTEEETQRWRPSNDQQAII